MIRRLATLAAAALLLGASVGRAQQPVPPAPPVATSGDSIRIYLVTMGQGDAVWELFGHNAIWVHDPSQPVADVVYNWGVFDFAAPGFIPRFLRGDMRYTMDGATLNGTLYAYQQLNRHVWAQELALNDAETQAMLAFLRWNMQPENRAYRYDYYLDNCSTRARDALDRVTNGALRAYLKSIPTPETYRSHSLRLMQRQPLTMTGVHLALGRPTDNPLSADEASFLPVQLMTHIRGVKLDGGTRPLVRREFTLVDVARPLEPAEPPALWKALVPIGLLLAAIVIVLGRPAARSRRLAATVIAIVAGLIGLVGTILLILALATDHVAAHWNENMFLLNPAWLILAVAGALAVLRGGSRSKTRQLAIAAAVLALMAVLIHLTGLSRQPNWDVIGLLLPVELAMAWVLFRRTAPGPAVTPA